MRALKINRENLRVIAGLNGTTVSALAAEKRCSRALLYLAAEQPEQYPAIAEWLEKRLPIRSVPLLKPVHA